MSETPARTDVIRHKVGTCPACRVGLYADLITEVYVGMPYVSSDTAKASASARTDIVGADIDHRCGKAAR